MRILGLDVGTKNIGVAISDPTMCIATGLLTIKRKTIEQDLEAIKELKSKYEFDTVVIGLPKNMNGTIGQQAIFVKNFGNSLKEKLNLNIVYIDERLTTVQAQKALRDCNINSKKQKAIIDINSAILILQTFLDKKNYELQREITNS